MSFNLLGVSGSSGGMGVHLNQDDEYNPFGSSPFDEPSTTTRTGFGVRSGWCKDFPYRCRKGMGNCWGRVQRALGPVKKVGWKMLKNFCACVGSGAVNTVLKCLKLKVGGPWGLLRAGLKIIVK